MLCEGGGFFKGDDPTCRGVQRTLLIILSVSADACKLPLNGEWFGCWGGVGPQWCQKIHDA